jgi:hypothetical protein
LVQLPASARWIWPKEMSPLNQISPKAGMTQGSKKMARGKCPSCKQTLSELVIDAHITGKVHASKSVRCINFLCPNCNTIVGSQMDPAPVKTETVDLLMQKLRYAS